MKYNIYFKETSRLSNVTKFRDGKLLISYEGKWKNNPSVNQNLDIFITSDEKWEMDSAIIRKRDIEIYAGFMSANKEKYSKIVMTNDQEFNRCSKTLPITNDILDWICNNLESKEIPIEKVSINIINKGIEELYRIKTNPMIFIDDAKITGIVTDEATKYIAGCDPIEKNIKTGSKVTIGEITDGFYKLCTLSDDQAKELQWAISIAMQVEGDGAKKSILEFMEENPIRDLVKTEDMQFLEMKKELSMAQILNCIDSFLSYKLKRPATRSVHYLTPLNWLKKHINEI